MLGDSPAPDSGDNVAEHGGRMSTQLHAYSAELICVCSSRQVLVLPQLYLLAEAVCEVSFSIIGAASGGIVTLPAMISCGVTLRP